MDYIINQLFNLTAIPSPSGFTAKASEYVLNEFKSMGFEGSMTKKGGVLVTLGGEGNPLVLSAHLDTLGAMVAEIKGNGRLRLLPGPGSQTTLKRKTVQYTAGLAIKRIRERCR